MKKLIIFAGPSAVGKTTLVNYMKEKNPELEYARSATTRAPRGDGNDSEYLYLSVSEFISTARSGGMLEYTEYAGNLYGTPKSEIERILRDGKIPVLVLDKEGVDSIKTAEEYPSFAVYLYEDLNLLEERLYQRYIGESPSASGLSRFCERKERNLEEFANIESLAGRFDFLVRNRETEKCSDEIFAAYASAEPQEKSAAIEEIKALLEAKFKGNPEQ